MHRGQSVTTAVAEVVVESNAPIPTWFGIGGRADRLARPSSIEQLRQCIQTDPGLRILGDGANLLVDDGGVGELVVVLDHPCFSRVERNSGTGMTSVGAGANLPKLITASVRQRLGGIEGLGGIPATLGGAVVMNAGGAFGQIADAVVRVRALDRSGRDVVLDRDEIDFSYRHSGLSGLIICSVDLDLHEEDPEALRDRLKEVMDYKKRSQPMADRSAGCVFKNPTLPEDLADIGSAGERVSAGMLIDRAGCKGLKVGSASVSPRHANFIVAEPATSRAGEVIALMDAVRARVRDAFGVELEPEVVIWKRN